MRTNPPPTPYHPPAADDLPDDLMPQPAACRLLSTHRNVLTRWRFAGRVRAWRRVGRWFYSRRELLRLYQLPAGSPPPLPPSAAERKRRSDEAIEYLKARGYPIRTAAEMPKPAA